MTDNIIYQNVEMSKPIHSTNKTDYATFNAFHSEREKSYKKTSVRSKREQIKENLDQWDEAVHDRYKKLSLRKMNSARSKKTIKFMVKSKNQNLFFYCDEAAEREKIVYAVIRDYVAMGLTSYSRVKHITDNDITMWGTVGFEGFNKLNNILSRTEVNIIVVHGFVDKSYTDKELRMLETVINHCFYNNIRLIFSSNTGLGFYKKVLTSNAFSALESLIGTNIINL